METSKLFRERSVTDDKTEGRKRSKGNRRDGKGGFG